MKKSVIILILIIYIGSIVFVGFFGMKMVSYNPTILPEKIECINSHCSIDKIYGGIYEIRYTSNGYEYYGLVNIYKDKQVIDITNIESKYLKRYFE